MTTQQRRQICKPLHIGDDVAGRTGGDLAYGASSMDMISYLALLRLWFACLTENLAGSVTGDLHRGFDYLREFEARALQEAADITSGKTRAPALIPESARAPDAPKVLLNRRAVRILRRGLPVSRRYGWFRYASPRTLNGNQFFELLARLSVNGRAVVYRLEYQRRLCKMVHVRERNNAISPLGFVAAFIRFDCFNADLSAAHFWPN